MDKDLIKDSTKIELLEVILSERLRYSNKWGSVRLILPDDDWPKQIAQVHRRKKDRCFIFWSEPKKPYPASPYHFREFYLKDLADMIEHQRNDLEQDKQIRNETKT